MPIGFLVPAVLAGLAAVLVPLVLHLRRRERRKPRPFPSLMFLARLPIQVDARRRLTDWPLLVLRALAIVLLVAAFARPFLKGRTVSGAGSAGLTVLAVDRSASMAAAGVATAWADSARGVIEALPAGRRVAVVAFDAAATILQGPTDDRAAAIAALQAAPAPGGGTRYGAGLRAAAQLLAHERVPGEIVVVTDLQRSGLAATAAPALPAGTTFRTVAVPPASRDNAAITDLDVQQVPAATGRRALVAARISRHGGDASRRVTAELEVDGRIVSRRTVELPAEGIVRVAFDTVAIARGDARVVARLDRDALASDDAFHAIVPADAATRVLLVAPSDARPDELRYVQQALSIGRDPVFSTERVTAVSAAALARSAVVILLDAVPPAGAMLAEWVGAGGGLIVVPGERLGQRRGDLSIVPAAMRGSAARETGAMLGDAETSHPVLAAFQGAAVDGFASVRVRRHPVIEATDDAAVLLRYDDGSAALVAGAVGAGRTLAVAIPLDVQGGDFPLQPAFLPFLRGAAAWAAGIDRGHPLAVTSGEPWLAPAAIRAPVFRGPDGDLTRPTGASRLLLVRTSGFHEVLDGQASGLPATLLAVNAPAAEADLSALPPGDLLLGVGEAEPVSALSEPEAIAAREARQAWWRWVLLLAGCILVVEVLVASRGWRAVAVHPASGDQKGVP